MFAKMQIRVIALCSTALVGGISGRLSLRRAGFGSDYLDDYMEDVSDRAHDDRLFLQDAFRRIIPRQGGKLEDLGKEVTLEQRDTNIIAAFAAVRGSPIDKTNVLTEAIALYKADKFHAHDAEQITESDFNADGTLKHDCMTVIGLSLLKEGDIISRIIQKPYKCDASTNYRRQYTTSPTVHNFSGLSVAQVVGVLHGLTSDTDEVKQENIIELVKKQGDKREYMRDAIAQLELRKGFKILGVRNSGGDDVAGTSMWERLTNAQVGDVVIVGGFSHDECQKIQNEGICGDVHVDISSLRAKVRNWEPHWPYVAWQLCPGQCEEKFKGHSATGLLSGPPVFREDAAGMMVLHPYSGIKVQVVQRFKIGIHDEVAPPMDLANEPTFERSAIEASLSRREAGGFWSHDGLLCEERGWHLKYNEGEIVDRVQIVDADFNSVVQYNPQVSAEGDKATSPAQRQDDVIVFNDGRREAVNHIEVSKLRHKSEKESLEKLLCKTPNNFLSNLPDDIIFAVLDMNHYQTPAPAVSAHIFFPGFAQQFPAKNVQSLVARNTYVMSEGGVNNYNGNPFNIASASGTLQTTIRPAAAGGEAGPLAEAGSGDGARALATPLPVAGEPLASDSLIAADDGSENGGDGASERTESSPGPGDDTNASGDEGNSTSTSAVSPAPPAPGSARGGRFRWQNCIGTCSMQ